MKRARLQTHRADSDPLSDVISYVSVLQSPLPALLLGWHASRSHTLQRFCSHSERKSMSSSISRWEGAGRGARGGDGRKATGGGVNGGSVGLQCGRVHGSHVAVCSAEQEDGWHRQPLAVHLTGACRRVNGGVTVFSPLAVLH